MTQLTVRQGEATRFDQTFVDADGDAINLTGASTYMHIKHKIGDDDTVLEIEGTTIAPASNGQAYFTLTSAQTEDLTECRYVYEVRLVNSGGEPSLIQEPETMYVVQSGKVPT